MNKVAIVLACLIAFVAFAAAAHDDCPHEEPLYQAYSLPNADDYYNSFGAAQSGCEVQSYINPPPPQPCSAPFSSGEQSQSIVTTNWGPINADV